MAQAVPFNLETEQAALGCVLIDNKLIVNLADQLNASDFYDRRHQIIYQAMLSIFNQELTIDFNTLVAELQIKGQLNDAGGVVYLSSLIDTVYTTANVDDYVSIVRDASMKRSLIAAAESIGQAGLEPTYTATQYMDYAERVILELSKKRKAEDLVPASEVVENVDKMMLAHRSRGSDIIGLTTGFQKLDEITLGLQKGNLVILAARPAMGKSAFAMNVAFKAAQKGLTDNNEKVHVALFSLEMSKEQIVQRIVASLSRVSLGQIQKGNVNQKEMSLIQNAYEQIKDVNIYFSDQGALTVPDIRAKCRKQQTNIGLDLVVIDYMQLINAAQKASSRQEEVSVISRSLKQMARELNVPVIALAQLSRDVEKREDKRPIMSDLRESGSIEQDADIVMFLYRDDYYHKGTSALPGVAELIIAKNRNGQSGNEANVKFVFQGEYQLFTPYDGN